MAPTKKKSEPALTYSKFVKFYGETLVPDMGNLVQTKLQEFEVKINRHFDFLFKNFEDLRQEYIIVLHQMKRFETTDETLIKNLAELQTKIAHLQNEVITLKQKLISQ